MKKTLTILILSFFIFANSFAGSDGELNLSKKSKPVKDCLDMNRCLDCLTALEVSGRVLRVSGGYTAVTVLAIHGGPV